MSEYLPVSGCAQTLPNLNGFFSVYIILILCFIRNNEFVSLHYNFQAAFADKEIDAIMEMNCDINLSLDLDIIGHGGRIVVS